MEHPINKANRSDTTAAALFSDGSVHLDPTKNWRECFPEIIGRSRALANILETVSKISRSDSSVLIYGASGTGKELIAAAVHRLSARAHKRFVPLNCSAIPESLLESELFGHERGAFTGATGRRPGHFEVADGGTLFLDEIGDMPLRLQAKLLRVLQEKQFTSVGGHQLKTADVRIIAATNIDLHEAVKEGRFRLDLFYRLNVLPVVMPQLHERKEDIVDLLDHFLAIANRINSNKPACYLSRSVIDHLVNYRWPGNIRELQNLVERLVVTSAIGGEVRFEDLPPEYQNPDLTMSTPTESSLPAPQRQERPFGESPSERQLPLRMGPQSSVQSPADFGALPEQGLDLVDYIAGIENRLIMQALQRTANNKNQAAKLLGLNRTTLVERLKKRNITLT